MVGQDGWINGWDGWMGDWINVQMNKQMTFGEIEACDGLMDECVDEQIALMDEQVKW